MWVRHADPEKIQALARAVEEGRLCDHVIPVPKILVGEDAADKEAAVKATGYESWYDFCTSRWGTKWDVEAYDTDVTIQDDNSFSVGFDSAWSPPIGVYDQLIDDGFEVDAMYWESGMAFCGRYNNHGDDHYDIGGMTAEDVERDVDPDINEMFSISENLREWAEDEPEELSEWLREGIEQRGGAV